MNKQIVVLIPIAFVVVVITPAIAFADTNESAYQFGYAQGRDSWNCYNNNADAGCFMGKNACTSTITNAAKVVTNQTACIDGFVNGWNKVCTHNIDGASDDGVSAICPDSRVNEGLPYNY